MKIFPELERVLQKILYRFESHKIIENIEVESIYDIQFLFTMETPINLVANPLSLMDSLFLPLNFTNIASHPHAIPDKAIEKLPTFQGNNAISASSHLSKFSKCLLSWCWDPSSQHDAIYMNIFSLSLEKYACD